MAAAVTRRGPQGSGFVGATGSGNVYAGRDGNVYRKQGDSWQKFDNGGWTGAQPTGAASDATAGQLDRDAAARSDGAQRTRDASTARSSSTARASGSYRPSGGVDAPLAEGGTRGGGGADDESARLARACTKMQAPAEI